MLWLPKTFEGQLGRSQGGHVLLAGQGLGWWHPMDGICGRAGGMHLQVEAGECCLRGPCVRIGSQGGASAMLFSGQGAGYFVAAGVVFPSTD